MQVIKRYDGKTDVSGIIENQKELKVVADVLGTTLDTFWTDDIKKTLGCCVSAQLSDGTFVSVSIAVGSWVWIRPPHGSETPDSAEAVQL